MLAYEIDIPRLYDFYISHDTNYGNIGRYYSNICGHSWMIDLVSYGGMYGGFVHNKFMYCPYCNKLHGLSHLAKKKSIADRSYTPWLSANLKLHKFKDSIRLEIKGNVLSTNRHCVAMVSQYHEVFRFDLKTKITTWRINRHEPIEITPWSHSELEDRSVINCITSRPNIDKPIRDNIANMLKLMRDYIVGSYKFKMQPISRTWGEGNSLLLHPIINMAFRLKFPDLPNLQVDEARKFAKSKVLLGEMIKGKSSADAMLLAAELPTYPSFRKFIMTYPLGIAYLKTAYEICYHDTQLTIQCASYNVAVDRYTVGLKYSIDLEARHKLESLGYTPMQIIDLLRSLIKLKSDKTDDIIHMLWLLTDEDVQLIRDVNPPKPSNLHDYLSEFFWRKRNPKQDFKYTYEDKALMYQEGAYRFFLPANNLELYHAGKMMSNCVGTYSEYIVKKKCNIILVTKDTDLVACLEINKSNSLVQAKLYANKPVEKNAYMRDIITRYADTKHLNYKNCADIYGRAV